MPAEEAPSQTPKEEEKEWTELTPAQRQKEENAKYFGELGEDYELPKPVMPESIKYNPSKPELDGEEQHHVDGKEREKPSENSLLPNTTPANESDENAMNPYERALRDNEADKRSFVDELRRQTEERKR